MTSLDALIPELQEPAKSLINLAGRAGVQPRVTSTLRTRAEQTRLYKRWQSGLNPYPVAPPGTSAHEYGYAFDLVVTGEQNQSDLGTVWQNWGGVYGGGNDPVHFEYPGFNVPQQDTSSGAAPVGGVAASVFDILVGMNPVVGYSEWVGLFLSLLPGLSENEVVKILASPSQGKVGQWVLTHLNF